jgi:hypothetical protein
MTQITMDMMAMMTIKKESQGLTTYTIRAMYRTMVWYEDKSHAYITNQTQSDSKT